jgi:hypothetical protein
MIKKSSSSYNAASITKKACLLLANGSLGDESLSKSATVGCALPVLAPEGELHSWFVPVTMSDKLVAFFQFLPNGVLMRFSSFQRKPGEIDSCPKAEDWLNMDKIQANAAIQRQENETIGKPVLTYDRVPDRLAWVVPLTNERGEVRYVYVAGETVYTSPSEETFD